LSRIAIGALGAFDVKPCRNPVGVARIVAAIPRVAEYSNLGLPGHNPVGVARSDVVLPPNPKGVALQSQT
jgi:hypothetical protein